MTDTRDPSSRSAGAPRLRLLRVAVPSPLRRVFDYLPSDNQGPDLPAPGTRVRVPFGSGTRVGVVLEHVDHTRVPRQRLKRISRVLDNEPLLSAENLAFLRWASDYFHHPIGEVVLGALPTVLRAGKPLPTSGEPRWRLTESGQGLRSEQFQRAPRQGAVWELLRGLPNGAGRADLARLDGAWRAALAAMCAKGWIEEFEAPAGESKAGIFPDKPLHSRHCSTDVQVPRSTGMCESGHPRRSDARADAVAMPDPVPGEPSPVPNDEQRHAIETVYAARDRFQSFLLDGVTGSGKTEVYLAVIERIIALGRQAMVLIPEIGLTPQIVTRLQERLSAPMAVLHSGMSDGERLQAWAASRDGRAAVVVGTHRGR